MGEDSKFHFATRAAGAQEKKIGRPELVQPQHSGRSRSGGRGTRKGGRGSGAKKTKRQNGGEKKMKDRASPREQHLPGSEKGQEKGKGGNSCDKILKEEEGVPGYRIFLVENPV